jgi:ribosomal protein L10
MKTFLKKKFQISRLKNLFETKQFIGIFFLNSLTSEQRIRLKRLITPLGFEIEILNNSLFQKVIKSFFPQYLHFSSLAQGFNLVLTPIKNESVNPIELKELFTLLKKEKKVIFLGGIYDKKLINVTFQDEIVKLNSTVFIELAQTIGQSTSGISKLLSSLPVKTLHLIGSIDTRK